ncbi:MAG TPA: alpha/beta fold hydrolase [Deltaproteobacteria bacterium]|jgi:hypothetical protein|nr:alpha/beta fold hydrolase [Deltaproteobacteria bacterium]HOI08142.1 alpha/beta fold hydrolase [Deltaproteobacteria bacterium]
MADVFIGDNPRLEAVCEDKGSDICAVITHPHSLMGGDMNNNVVMTAWNTVLEQGCSALRFNFRGVGRSRGRFDEGIGETADLAAAVQFAGRPVVVIGYSFGSWVASRYLEEADVPCVFISPPTALFPFPSLRGRKVWSITGSFDQFCDVNALEKVQDKERITVVQGVDHFWFGGESRLRPYLETTVSLIRSASF